MGAIGTVPKPDALTKVSPCLEGSGHLSPGSVARGKGKSKEQMREHTQ